MQIDQLMTDPGASANIFYDPTFRNVLEDHMSFLRADSRTKQLNIEPEQAYRFEGDLFGLLAYYKLPAYMHWVTMRMNQMSSPQDAGRDITLLVFPDERTLSQIRQSHMTTRRIT